MSGKVQTGKKTSDSKENTQRSEISSLRKQASDLKHQLRSKEQLLDILNSAFSDGWFIHEKGHIQKANEGFCRLIGYSLEHLQQIHIKDVFGANGTDILKKMEQVAFGPLEVHITNKSGEEVYSRVTGKEVVFSDRKMGFVVVEDISDIITTKSHFEESEERHRLISMMLSDYVYACKVSKTQAPVIEWISGAIEKISGYTIEEIDEMEYGWFSILHPDDLKRIRESVGISFENNKFNNQEYRIIHKDGRVRWVHDRSTYINFDERNGEYFLLGATKDITERKQIEQDLVDRNVAVEKLNKNLKEINIKLSNVNQQLKESEEKYKNLIENSSIGVGISKGEKILYANESLLNIYGIKTLEEFASKNLTEYMTAESKKDVKERLRKYKNGIPTESTYRYEIIRSDGAVRTVQITTDDIVFEGELCRQALITDITKNLETENALQQAANIFMNIQIGIFIYRLDDLTDDRSLRMLHANPASAQLTGYSEVEMIGRRIDELFPNLRDKKIPQQYAEVVRTQIPISFDEINYKDGHISSAVFSVKVFPLPDQCVGVSFENVSARRKAQKELQTRNNELNNFVYKVSHDLRAPLSSIKGLIHLSKLENNGTDHLPKIEERINRLDAYIKDILSHSRNLNTAVIVEEVKMMDVIAECFKELEYLPKASKIKKTVSVSGEQLYNDRIRLSEICRNMISNAIKYQDGDKPQSWLKIDVQISKERARITFEDNGIGIEQTFLSDIFKMFYRATEESEGSGIGLYIVQQALEKIDGGISVESTVGKGTSFQISVPNLISKKVAVDF